MRHSRPRAIRPAALRTVLVTTVALLALVVAACAGPGRPTAAGPPSPSPAQAVVPAPSVSPTAAPSSSAPAKPTPAPSSSARKAAPPTARATPATTIADRLRTLPANTTQVVIVHAPTSATTYATLETFTKVGKVWQRAYPPMAARIGSLGFSDNHKEAVPTTPVGVYGFGPTMYGINADPGVRYAYHHLVSGDWWDENPSSPNYNTFQHGSDPGGVSEALWQATVAYQYFAFITFNVPAIPGKGSGIFLHVGTGGPTAGCVSLAETNLLTVLRWLDPAKHPRIVLSPDSELHKF